VSGKSRAIYGWDEGERQVYMRHPQRHIEEQKGMRMQKVQLTYKFRLYPKKELDEEMGRP
jgi:hypothetical protein